MRFLVLLICIAFLLTINSTQDIFSEEDIIATLEPTVLFPGENNKQILTFDLNSLISKKSLDPLFPYEVTIWKDDVLVSDYYYLGNNGILSISLIPNKAKCGQFNFMECTEYFPERKIGERVSFFDNNQIKSSAFGKPGKYKVDFKIYNEYNIGNTPILAIINPIFSKSFTFDILESQKELPETLEELNKSCQEEITPGWKYADELLELCHKFDPSNNFKPEIDLSIIPDKVKYGDSVHFYYSLPNYDKPDFERYSFYVLNPEGVEIDATLWMARNDSDYEFQTNASVFNIVKAGKYQLVFEKSYNNERTGEIVKTGFFEITTNPPPLVLSKRGVNVNQISCNEGLSWIIRVDNSSACVKPESIPKLIERGWAKNSDIQKIPDQKNNQPITESQYKYKFWEEHIVDYNRIFFSYSKDYGQTFSNPIELSMYEINAMEPTMIVANDNVILSWRDEIKEDKYLALAISKDHGLTFEKKYVAHGARPDLFFKNGILYLTWVNLDNRQVLYSKSENLGETFSEPFVVFTPEGQLSPYTLAPTPTFSSNNEDIFINWKFTGKDYQYVIEN